MDTLRVIGNEAVHPGTIDLTNVDQETIESMFTLLNLIVDDRISRPQQVAKMYEMLPANKIEGINNRDARNR